MLVQSLPMLDSQILMKWIAQQVREEANRLAHAQQQGMVRQEAPSEIGGDELDMLADACAELGQTVATGVRTGQRTCR